MDFCDQNYSSIAGLIRRDHQRSAFLVNQKHQEFCRLGTTSVPANDVNIVGIFIKALAWFQRELFFPSHLHYDRTLQHVNKHLRSMPVGRTRKAWRKIYGI